MKIGFIGQGFIGKNYANDMEERGHAVVRYALEPEYASNKAAISTCDIVFIAVPTPTTPAGFDDSIVREAISLTAQGTTVVIKSTLVPGTTESLQAAYPEHFVMHSPEFLTETNAAHDARNPIRNIVGIPHDTPEYRTRAEAVIALLSPAPFTRITTAREAEMIKYAANCFLYSKVVMANLFYDLARVHNCAWETIRDALIADPRIGPSHLDPVHKSGPHATTVGRGAGGHCFMKDFESFRRAYAELGDPLGSAVLDAMVIKNNQLLRSSGKDLDILKGVYGE